MKHKFQLIIVLSLICSMAFGQKYKVKKNVLYDGKTKVGTVSGTFGSINGYDMTIYTNSGLEVARIYKKEYDNIFAASIPIEVSYKEWYIVDVKGINEQFFLAEGKPLPYLGKQAFIKRVFGKKGVKIYEDGFHKDELANIQSIDEKISADTTNIQELISALGELGKSIPSQWSEGMEVSLGKSVDDYDDREGLISGKPTYLEILANNPGEEEKKRIGGLTSYETTDYNGNKIRYVTIAKYTEDPISAGNGRKSHLVPLAVAEYFGEERVFLLAQNKIVDKTEFAFDTENETSEESIVELIKYLLEIGEL